MVGGAAALQTTWIEAIEDVDFEELNPECLWKFRIRGFGPLLVDDGFAWRLAPSREIKRRPARRGILADIGASE